MRETYSTVLAIIALSLSVAACDDADLNRGFSDGSSGSGMDTSPGGDGGVGSVCTPTTCAAQGASCGALSDGCDGILQCGDCSGGQTCGAGGLANQCGEGMCTPTTCELAGATCGTIPDQCSGTLACGDCGSGKQCQANTCVDISTCQVTTSCGSADCGNKPDNCGGTLFCGPCVGNENCDWLDSDTGASYNVKTYDVKSTTISGVDVDYLLIPEQDTIATERVLWSTWGEGEIHSSGKYYGAFGDHALVGGNSWLYEYDPTSKKVRIVGDALFAHDYQDDSYGYGKVHAQVDEGPCGVLYLNTYRGDTRGSVNSVGKGSYNGDLLLRYNPVTGHLKSLGEVQKGWQSPSTNLWREGGLLYGEGVTGPRVDGTDPFTFWVYDLNSNSLLWNGPTQVRTGRNIAIDNSGRAYFNAPDNNSVFRYTPPDGANPQGKVSDNPIFSFPNGSWLRSSTRARSDGTLVLATNRASNGNGDAYLFDPATDKLTPIGALDGYVTSIALTPDEKAIYAVGNSAHGSTKFELQKFDIATGNRTTVVTLSGNLTESGMTPTGTYDVQVSKDGTVYMTTNAGPPGELERVMFLAVHAGK